jgi:hypothetical protein
VPAVGAAHQMLPIGKTLSIGQIFPIGKTLPIGQMLPIRQELLIEKMLLIRSAPDICASAHDMYDTKKVIKNMTTDKL